MTIPVASSENPVAGYFVPCYGAEGGPFTPASAATPAPVYSPGGVSPSSNFTRPANTTAYASGQLVANSTTAGSVVPLSWSVARVAAGSGMVRRCTIQKSGTSATNAQFRLHLFAASPTVANGDGGTLSASQSTNYLGSMDATLAAFSDGCAGQGAPNIGGEINFALASGQTIYGLIEARAAYTPVSGEVFTVTLEVLQH